MTNREKFKEVFGMEILGGANLCDIVSCTECPECNEEECNGEEYWDEEYKAPEEQ